MFQELFSKQKGYLDEELDYRKQVLDQAHKVRELWLPNARRALGVAMGRSFPAASSGVSLARVARPQTPDRQEPGPSVTVWGYCLHLSLWSPVTWRVLRVPAAVIMPLPPWV